MILDATCKARCKGNLKFSWSLFKYDDFHAREPRNLSALERIPDDELARSVSNPIGELSLAFKPHSLLPNTKYTLQLIAARPSGVFGEFRRMLRINQAPNGGIE